MRVVNIKELYHIGFMDIKDKSNHSLEGSGLSVSSCPSSWRKIARLGGRPTYKLAKENGNFLDCYSLSKKGKAVMAEWGLENGYIKKGTVYIALYLEEDGEEYHTYHFTYDEALRETEYDEDSDENSTEEYVKEKDGFYPTEKMKTKAGVRVEIMMTESILAMFYAEDVLKLDGVWWNEMLDVYSYSAPRAVIFNSRIEEWDVSEIELKNAREFFEDEQKFTYRSKKSHCNKKESTVKK